MHTTDPDTYNRALGACLATLAAGVWSDDGVDLTEDAQARLSATLQGSRQPYDGRLGVTHSTTPGATGSAGDSRRAGGSYRRPAGVRDNGLCTSGQPMGVEQVFKIDPRYPGEGGLECPVCGFQGTHIDEVRIAARDEDQEPNNITVNAVTGQVLTHQPEPVPGREAPRRHRIALIGWCENGCHFAVTFGQHKGHTLVETEKLPLSAVTPPTGAVGNTPRGVSPQQET